MLKSASTERMVRGSWPALPSCPDPDLTQSPLGEWKPGCWSPLLPQTDHVTLSVSLTLSEPWFFPSER